MGKRAVSPILIATSFFGAVPASLSQTTTPPPYFYEVASVKPSLTGQYADHITPGQFGAAHISLYALIRVAFAGLKKYQFVMPAWTETVWYDVTGKVPPGATPVQRSAMLQNLVIERFGLEYHYEFREVTVYDLVVTKSGHKMQGSHANEKGDSEKPPKVTFGPDRLPILSPEEPPRTLVTGSGGQTSIVTNQLSMTKLAEMLSSQLGTDVFDKTGLTEQYSFLLHFLPIRGRASIESPFQSSKDSLAGVPEAAIDPLDVVPTIFAALQSQLGLRLNRHRGPVDVLVVDKAARMPIEN